MIVVLVVLNTVGVQEATRVSVVLAVVDFVTQIFLVILGFVLVVDPQVLVDNVHWGVAPTWANLAIAIPVAMLAYTGVETVSNLAEEARDPSRSVPLAYKLVAGAVFAIYFTLPLVALSAMPVERIDGELTTKLALPPEKGGFANDPVLGIVDNLGVHGTTLRFLQIYVGLLAATILFMATNAGVIGASRITYSMATYRQMPEIFRRLHPRFKTPWLSLLVFAGIAPICVILPGSVTFVGTLYSFGATLSFTVAHASIVRCAREGRPELLYKGRPNLRVRGVDWPLFAIARRGRDRHLVRRHPRPEPDDALGRPRLARDRLRRLHRLPAPLRPRVADGHRQGAAAARAGLRARVPHDHLAGRGQPAVARGRAHRLPAGGGAALGDRRHARDRRPDGAAARRGAARAGAARRRPARRGARHRRALRRPR